MRDPVSQLERVGRLLGVEVEADALKAAIDRAVEASLWHHTEAVEPSDPFLLPEAIELHRLLKSHREGPDLETRAKELRRSGLARIGPVAENALPALRGTHDAVATESERFDPDSMSGTIEAEHVLRYLLAAQLASGRVVLDAGCGYGYGTAILAGAGASRAIGIDISEEAIEAARAHGDAQFETGDVASLPFDDDSFDLVTCFEAIEHLVRRDEALDELARVLRPSGVLLISTPNRLRYDEGNPHHVYEYEPDEFRLALETRFENVRLLRQYTLTASVAISDERRAETALEVPGGWSGRVEPGREIYTLALASNSALPALPATATVVPPDDPDSPENQAAEAVERNASLQRRNSELQRRNRELHEKNQEQRARLIRAESGSA